MSAPVSHAAQRAAVLTDESPSRLFGYALDPAKSRITQTPNVAAALDAEAESMRRAGLRCAAWLLGCAVVTLGALVGACVALI